MWFKRSGGWWSLWIGPFGVRRWAGKWGWSWDWAAVKHMLLMDEDRNWRS